jgi:hypothetical protein
VEVKNVSGGRVGGLSPLPGTSAKASALTAQDYFNSTAFRVSVNAARSDSILILMK